jgi:hypothetical protein
MPTRITTAIFLAIAAEFSAEPVAAQQPSRGTVEPGAARVTISGMLAGQEAIAARPGNAAGQTLEAGIVVDGSNGVDTIRFDISPPGAPQEALVLGQRLARVMLPEGGDDTIRVLLMGSVRDAGRTVDVRLPVAIC